MLQYQHNIASRWAAQLTNLPSVSCICPTYGRPAVLEEAIYSFLQQDYPGKKELIVLNDYDQQILAFDHPEVQVINVPRRFRTVGEKRNAAVALASHDLLFVWDDDDIYLPHRLSFSVAGFERKKGFFKPDLAWMWRHGQLTGPRQNFFHSQSCWSRKLFDAIQGYDAEGSGHDQLFERRLGKKFPGSTKCYAVQPEEIYYIYRWIGTDSYHLSGFGGFRPGENGGYNEVAAFVQQRVSRGEIRQGYIPLQPGWKTDYQQLVSDAIASLAEQPA
jgi:glycosyltransferase involved in cell wall biosynthesis